MYIAPTISILRNVHKNTSNNEPSLRSFILQGRLIALSLKNMTTLVTPRYRAIAAAFGFALALAYATFSAVPVAQAAEIFGSLSLGSTGTDVTTLQTYLSSDSTLYPEGLVTGYYGTLTQAAVTRFQARYGISQTGTVGPITRAKLNEIMSGGNAGGPITGGDVWAPTMTPEVVAKTSTTANISWSTSEPAVSKIYYATFWPIWPWSDVQGSSAADPIVDNQSSITLTGLTPNTLYYYMRESVDPSGNVMWTVASTFRTNP